MAEAPAARPPEFAATAWLQPLPQAARLIFCGDDTAERALVAALALPGPAATCTASSNAARSMLWLGPDERLLLAPADQRLTLIAAIAATLAGQAHSLVDISHRQVAFALHGSEAVRLLNAQCPLELTLAAFPVGMCTRTIYAKSEIVLWRTATDRFHIEVWRSFAPYMVTLLQDVARESGG